MLFTPKNVKKFLQGGLMPAEETMAPEGSTSETAPAEGAGLDPLMLLVEAAAQALQTQDTDLAMQVCQGLVALVQQMKLEVSLEPQGEPVFRKGGVLLRRIKK